MTPKKEGAFKIIADNRRNHADYTRGLAIDPDAPRSRIGALAPGIAMADIERVCGDAKVNLDEKLGKLVGALGEGIARVEYGRAGDRAGVAGAAGPAGSGRHAPSGSTPGRR